MLASWTTPTGNDASGAVVWSLGIIAVFGPLSAWHYGCAVTRVSTQNGAPQDASSAQYSALSAH